MHASATAYARMQEFTRGWMDYLVARRLFDLANRLHEALEIAENSVMLYSEVSRVFDEQSVELLTSDLQVEVNRYFDEFRKLAL